MKTLDEVIKANECCDHGEPDSRCEDCPYNGIGACCAERESDALHYLREFQGLSKMWNDKLDKEQANPALTWDELRTMEGKPVWVEGTRGNMWIIVGAFPKWMPDAFADSVPNIWWKKEDLGRDWQAYRKERE